MTTSLNSDTGIKLYAGVYIVNEERFVEAHKATVERNKGKVLFEPYRERLGDYYRIKKTKQ